LWYRHHNSKWSQIGLEHIVHERPVVFSSSTVEIPEQLDSRETLDFLEFIPEKASLLWQGWQDMRLSGRPISFLDAMLEYVTRKPDAVKEQRMQRRKKGPENECGNTRPSTPPPGPSNSNVSTHRSNYAPAWTKRCQSILPLFQGPPSRSLGRRWTDPFGSFDRSREGPFGASTQKCLLPCWPAY